MIAAALETIEERTASRRRRQRRRLRLDVASQAGDGAEQQVQIHDLSETGLLIESDVALGVRETITVELPEAPASTARVVWHSGHFYGCQFVDPIPAAAVSAALLRSPAERPAFEAEPWPEPSAELPYGVERGTLPISARLQIVIAVSVLLWVLILAVAGIA